MREVTDAYIRVTGGKPETVWVIVEETAKENWGFGGVTLAERAAKAGK